MIKQLKKYDVQTTPFTVAKSWELLNVQHQDLVLLEVNSEFPAGDDTFVALEFIDYDFEVGYGVLNSACNIALEQQASDPVIYEEGISGSGLFYPSDPKNITGTYQRLMYHHIMRAFYNNTRNPTQVFGLENIDFQTSQIQKYPSTHFKVFSLPQEKFGDKIVEGSVVFVDNTFDDNYTVRDDKNGNLFASSNLFSKSQEVGNYGNILVDGTAVYECPSITTGSPVPPTELTASALSYSGSYLNWVDNSADESGFYIWRTEDSGSTWLYIGSVGPNVTASYDLTLEQTSSYSYRVASYNTLGSSSYSNTASISTPTE